MVRSQDGRELECDLAELALRPADDGTFGGMGERL